MQPTPIYGGGTRRSAAPTVFQIAPSGTGAATANSLLSAFSRAPAGASTVPSNVSRGGFTEFPSSGFSSGSTNRGDNVATAQTGNVNQGIGTLGALGSMVANLGFLGRDAELAQFGANVGKAATVANAVANPSVANFAPIAMQAFNVSPAIGGAVMGYGRSGVPGAVGGFAQGMLALASPPAAAVNALMGMFGLPTIQSTVKGWATPVRDAAVSSVSDVLASQANEVAAAQNIDPLEALMTLTQAFGTAGSDSYGGGFGFGGVNASDTGNLGFGGGSLGGFATEGGGSSNSGGSANSGNGPGGSPNEGGLGGFGGW